MTARRCANPWRILSARERHLRPLAAFLLCVCVCLALACRRGEADARGPTARVERGRLERIVVATGTIEAENEVEVRSRIPGIIERIHVSAGEAVKAGQTLIELERELLVAQVTEAQAGVSAVKVEAHYARLALDRAQGLSHRDVASERALDDARARSEAAQAGLAKARAALESLDVQLRYATIRAPRDGRVLEVAVEEGAAISSVASVTGGTLLLTLGDASGIFLEGLVDENEVARISVGRPARIRTEAHPDRTFDGTLRKIEPLGRRIQNVTYFEVEIAIEGDAAALLRPRMSADADIVAEVVENALQVPDTALRWDENGIHVRRRLGEGSEESEDRRVEIGIVQGARVELRSGLDEGDVVELQ